jgi:hypothetical protein
LGKIKNQSEAATFNSLQRFSLEVTGTSCPLLTFTYHGGRGSVAFAKYGPSFGARTLSEPVPV